MNRYFLPLAMCVLTGAAIQLAGQTPGSPSPKTAGQISEEALIAERDHPETAKWQVAIDVAMVAVPEPLAVELLPAFQSHDPKKVEDAWNAILVSVAKKESKLLAWPHVTCLSSQRAVTEGVMEKRYPVEFSLAQPGERTADPKAVNPNPTVASAYETRNTGATLEAEPRVLDGGRRIQINLVPQRVVLSGWKTFIGDQVAQGLVGTYSQPEFTVTKSTTSVNIANGQRLLLGVHTLETLEGSIELHILHARAVPVQ